MSLVLLGILAAHGLAADARLHAGAGRGVRVDREARGGGPVRGLRPLRPPLEREPARARRLPPHAARLLHGRLPRRARAQLARRPRPARRDRRVELHGIPAAVGPARLLGGHDRHRDGGVRAPRGGRARRRSCAAGPRSAPRRSGRTTRSTRSGCPRCSSPVRSSTSGACGGRAGSSCPRTPSATRGGSRSRSCSCRTCCGARRRWRSLLLAAVSLFSALVRAPLGPAANPGLSLNPAKAPWYFLGFQELLVHLHPLFAVVVVPALGALALVALPYLGFAKDEPRGAWFLSENGRRTARLAAAVALVATPLLVVADEALLGAAGAPAGGAALVTRGLLPVAALLAVCARGLPPVCARAARRHAPRGGAGALRLPRDRVRRPDRDGDLVPGGGDEAGVAVERVTLHWGAAAAAFVSRARVARDRRRGARGSRVDRRLVPEAAPEGAQRAAAASWSPGRPTPSRPAR